MLTALNAIDLVLTLILLDLGGAEGNPILAAAYRRSAGCFVAVKVGLAGFGIGVLWKVKRGEGVRVALLGCVILYSGVVALHAVAIYQRISSP